jgi:hypothetical protein
VDILLRPGRQIGAVASRPVGCSAVPAIQMPDGPLTGDGNVWRAEACCSGMPNLAVYGFTLQDWADPMKGAFSPMQSLHSWAGRFGWVLQELSSP